MKGNFKYCRVLFLGRFLMLILYLQFANVENIVGQESQKNCYFENLMGVKDSLGTILVFEDNSYKLKGDGIHFLLKKIEKNAGIEKNKIIVLRNNIPHLLMEKKGEKWDVSYDTDQAWREIKGLKRENRSLFKVDLVFYPELYLRNIKLEKIYDVMINLSPAVEVSLWRGMKFTGQLIFPILNQYGEEYSEIRPGYVTISQDIRFRGKWFVRGTAGLFNKGRWGFDVKAFHPLKNERFAVKMQLGLTGPYAFDNWVFHYGLPKRLTWSLGAQYYNPRFNLQFDLDAGRYIGKDYGVRADMTRHFKHVSIGLFAMKGNKADFGGGFNFAIALPPYKQRKGGFRVTTADYFFLEYNAVNDPYNGNMYKTAPGECKAKDNFNPYNIKTMSNYLK